MEEISQELEDFDWFNHKGPKNPEPFEFPRPTSIMQIQGEESAYDRKMRMLTQLSQTCISCSMCELGLKPVSKDNKLYRDPHVLSNMNPTRFMIVGQNPGWNEVVKREPFVGDAGENFNTEIAKYDLSREDFYICNTVRCYTQNNASPTPRHMKRCEPFLAMEINLIKPKLIIALGAIAFEQLCPGVTFSSSFEKLTKSSKYDVHVMPIYHPSPLNMKEESRRLAFGKQIRTMCKLIKALKNQAQ